MSCSSLRTAVTSISSLPSSYFIQAQSYSPGSGSPPLMMRKPVCIPPTFYPICPHPYCHTAQNQNASLISIFAHTPSTPYTSINQPPKINQALAIDYSPSVFCLLFIRDFAVISTLRFDNHYYPLGSKTVWLFFFFPSCASRLCLSHHY